MNEARLRTVCRLPIVALVVGMLAIGSLPVLAANAQNARNATSEPDVTLEVDGLACPFCAYGIEKKLMALEGVDAIEVHIEEGTIEMMLADETLPTEEQIRDAVADAGFTVRSITWRTPAD